MIILDGKLIRGKFKGKRLVDLTNEELIPSAAGFNCSGRATMEDRVLIAAELSGRGLPIPNGFCGERAIHRRSVNGSKAATNGSSNTNGHTAAETNPQSQAKAKPRQQRSEPELGIGEIAADVMYCSKAFRRRLSSGRGPMTPDTLTDWINCGLRVENLADGRKQILGRWFHEWVERGRCPESEKLSAGSERKLPIGRLGVMLRCLDVILKKANGSL